jgi:hypothetical protein
MKSNPDQLLFDLGEAQREKRCRHISVMCRKFSVTFGQTLIEIRELSSSTAYYSGQKLKVFAVSRAEMEKGKGTKYNLRAEIIERLKA